MRHTWDNAGLAPIRALQWEHSAQVDTFLCHQILRHPLVPHVTMVTHPLARRLLQFEVRVRILRVNVNVQPQEILILVLGEGHVTYHMICLRRMRADLCPHNLHQLAHFKVAVLRSFVDNLGFKGGKG